MPNCSICGSSIGRFEKPFRIPIEEHELLACTQCAEKLKSLDSPSDSYTFGIACRYFEGYLGKGSVSPAAKKLIEDKLSSAEMAKAALEAKAQMGKEAVELIRSGKFLMTTGDLFAGYEIVAYHGVFSSDCIMGTGMIADLDMMLTDITGAESDNSAHKVTIARERALERMAVKCAQAGGNAILGIRYDVYNAATNAFCVGVSGTSVTVRKI